MKIGLLGGTFDPVHLGHLLLAEGVREALSLDQILWIPAHAAPHRPTAPAASPEDRCRMVELAIQDHPHFRLSRLELDRPPPSYTIETVLRFQKDSPGSGHEYYFLLGAEAAAGLPFWRESQRLFALVQFVAVPRPGVPVGRLPEQVRLLPVQTLDLSASQIRQRVREGRSIRYWVPEPVRRFIEQRGLYR